MRQRTQYGIGLLVAMFGCVHPHAHGGAHDPLGMGLTVLATGEARAAPDRARASIGIELRAATAEQATEQANQQMGQVIAALEAAGVAEADLRTHDFSISFERDFTPEPVPVPTVAPAAPEKRTPRGAQVATEPAPGPRGSYRVSNVVEVLIRKVDQVSQVLSAATRAGANNVWGVSFELADQQPLHAQARAQAIARAKENAAQLAQLAGVELGRIVAIDDPAGDSEPRAYAGAAMRLAKDESAPVPVEHGEITVTHRVRLVYALER